MCFVIWFLSFVKPEIQFHHCVSKPEVPVSPLLFVNKKLEFRIR